jgi:hypothetical protein
MAQTLYNEWFVKFRFPGHEQVKMVDSELGLIKEEESEVKQVARELLETLKREKLVLDWRKRQQTRAGVEVAIKDILDKLPASYSAEVYEKKCLEVYQHIYENYSERDMSIYQILKLT